MSLNIGMRDIPKDIAERLIFKTSKKDESAPPTLKKVIHEAKPCDDCGTTVCDRHIHISYLKSEKTWIERCVNCNLYRNPLTDDYELSNYDLRTILRNRHKKDDK